jgi:hypothetical protein
VDAPLVNFQSADPPEQANFVDGIRFGKHVHMCLTRIAGISSPEWWTLTPSLAIHARASEAIKAAIDAIKLAKVFIFGIQSHCAVPRKACRSLDVRAADRSSLVIKSDSGAILRVGPLDVKKSINLTL